MHIAQYMPDHAVSDTSAFEPAGAGFAYPSNAFGVASGCASSWTNGCSGHHYRSWNDPTLQAHAFDLRADGGIDGKKATAPDARSSLRLALAFAGRCFQRQFAG